MDAENQSLRILRDMDEPTLREYFSALAGCIEELLPAGPSEGKGAVT